MEIALRVITGCLISVSVSILIDILQPILLKKERENEEKAKSRRSVYVGKRFAAVFISLLIFLNVIGVLIVALPGVITEYFKFNYVATICIWWIPIVFDDVVALLLFTRASYDDEKITVKKPFRKPKAYYYGDIISFSKTGNLKVVTKKGRFVLFNALAGTKSLRSFIIEKTPQV